MVDVKILRTDFFRILVESRLYLKSLKWQTEKTESFSFWEQN